MNDLPGYEKLGSTWTEICAYGTAVKASRRQG
jgi:uncharacterized protein YbjQ (UPF0145 family)